MQLRICIFFLSVVFVAQQVVGQADSKKPDIVVFLADDLSAADLPIYGGTDIETPAISRLASEGLTFNRAFVASPSCAPSRAALLTGLMPARNGAEENHTYPSPDLEKLPVLLNQLGYQTAAFGKVAHARSAKDYDFETINLQGNIPELRESVGKFLENRIDARPLALFVGVSDPHVPWPNETTVDDSAITIPPQLLDTPRTRVQRSRYLQEVKDLDGFLGEVVQISKNQLDPDTIFVFSSDHGAQFPFGKWTLYDEGIQVPLIIAQAGQPTAGKRTDAMVSWVDLLPTLIEMAGGEVSAKIDGQSFRKVVQGESETHRNQIFTTHSGDRMMNVYLSRSIRNEQFKLIFNPHPEFAFTTHIDLLLRVTSGDYFKEWQTLAESDSHAESVIRKYHQRPKYELFDLKADPHELNNLADLSEYNEVKNRLSNELEKWMEEQGDELTVFHEPLFFDAPESWVPRRPLRK